MLQQTGSVYCALLVISVRVDALRGALLVPMPTPLAAIASVATRAPFRMHRLSMRAVLARPDTYRTTCETAAGHARQGSSLLNPARVSVVLAHQDTFPIVQHQLSALCVPLEHSIRTTHHRFVRAVHQETQLPVSAPRKSLIVYNKNYFSVWTLILQSYLTECIRTRGIYCCFSTCLSEISVKLTLYTLYLFFSVFELFVKQHKYFMRFNSRSNIIEILSKSYVHKQNECLKLQFKKQWSLDYVKTLHTQAKSKF